MLDVSKLKKDLFEGIKDALIEQSLNAQNGNEDESPEAIIDTVVGKIAEVVAKSVHAYVQSGDIVVNNTHISVTTASGPATVTSIKPAKIN
jgi:hypothetical protein